MITRAFRVARGAWVSSAEPDTVAEAATREYTRARTITGGQAFIAIMLVAAVVRLWGLGSQPILYFDSGVYLGEGAFLASVAERAATALVNPGAGGPLERIANATESGTDGHPPDIAKPGHAVLLAVAFLLLGKSVLAGGLVSALTGIGTVAATYAIGMRGWGPRVALPAAALLSISGQHLVYSREPLVEADGLFFATLASLLYLQARSNKALFAAGAVWGVAFSCNNRLAYLPAILVVAELAAWPGWGGLARRGAMIAAGFAAPLATIEAGYLLARGIGRATTVTTDWLDYGQQLAAFSRMNPPDRLRLDEWPTYFADLALMDGFPLLVLLIAGIVVLIWRLRAHNRSREDLLLAGSLLIPLALYSVYSTGEVRLRHFSLALPWVMLAGAVGLARFSDLTRRWRNVALTGAVAALVVLAVPRVLALDAAPSGMPAVVEAIGANGRVASTNGPVLSFFIGEQRTNARLREAFVNTPPDLVALARGYPLLLVDMQAAVFAGEMTDVYARATPELVVANGSDAWYLADLLEHYGMPWGGWDDLLARWRDNRDIATQLRLYDLNEIARLI